MNRTLKRTLAFSAVATALAIAPLAQATNGYFKIGYGSKNRGMAGAGMAFGQDSLAPAVNPATLIGIGDRVDVGVELFNPQREGAVDARGMSVPDLGGAGPRQGTNSREDSGATVFAIPNFGMSRELNNRMTVGLSMVANGGMNTRYGDPDDGTGNIYTDAFAPVIGDTSTSAFQPGPSGFAGFLEAFQGVPAANIDPNLANLYLNPNTTPSLGVNLVQLLITPTVAYRLSDNHSIGVAPVIGYQRFRAYGLGLFQAFSSDPGNVTNKGDDDAWGLGGRIGYQGNFGWLSIGASYTSQIYMQEFDDYAGLFAEEGDFDIPSTYGIGLAITPTSRLTIAADVTRINYSDVAAINNEGPTADEFFNAFTGALVGNPALVSNPLGTDDGWGFGWDDVTVYKIGVNYAYSNQWTFRAGYNYAESPYDDDQVLFNVIAPGLVEQHATVGFTYMPTPNNELTVTYMHAFRNDQSFDYQGTGGFANFGYSVENAMSQNAIEASYAWKF